MAMFVINTYRDPARLFVLGGIELKSTEGTTQGDLLAMSLNATSVQPLLLLYWLAVAQQDNAGTSMTLLE